MELQEKIIKSGSAICSEGKSYLWIIHGRRVEDLGSVSSEKLPFTGAVMESTVSGSGFILMWMMRGVFCVQSFPFSPSWFLVPPLGIDLNQLCVIQGKIM